jgi:hypothetical protein
MDLEVDFAGDEVEVKDTFIRYDLTAALALTAGRFKRPVSFIGMASTWDLPRIDRGLLSELRIEERRLLFAGGRGDGVAAKLEPPAPWRPELTVVVHQSQVADEYGLEVTEGTQDVFGRAEIEPLAGLSLAIAGGWAGALGRIEDGTSYRHAGFGTLEARVETARLRLWAEAMAGDNASSYADDGVQRGRFVAAQALAAARLEELVGLRAVEPYAAVAWYEPSTAAAGDRLTEVTGGATVWISGKLRLQAEGGRRIVEGLPAEGSDTWIARVQLGARFEEKVEVR